MKQRLVGTIVLGSLALIIIPMLLDGEGVEPPPLTLSIPPPPVLDPTPIADPERPLILADQTEPLPVVQPPFTDSEEPFAVADASPAPASDPAEAPAADPAPLSTVDSAPAATTATAAEPRSLTAPARDAQGLPEAWTVRLGVFSDRANAEALVARLLAAGHKAYLQPVATGQGSLSGVFVGPVLTRREADVLQGQLAASYQENGLVMQYRIAP